MSEFEGRCLCGAVRFAVAAPTLFFYDQRADWIEVGDSLPRHTSDDPGLAKFKAVPP